MSMGLSATPRTVAYQASLSMGFSRQQYCSGLPFPSQRIFPAQGSNPDLPHCRQTLYPLSHQRNPEGDGSCYNEKYYCCSVAQSRLTLCNPMGASPARSSVCGAFQARTLEWVAISFSRGSSRPRDQTCVSCMAGRLFTTEP